ncbi:MAG: formylglycine-generating enzyme family protein [Chloroflexaceae bacterium]|nr:formylglycine-generating enzyme family protein [Chloroflexaceae bacterium]NJO04097.1 formylglycine-generating enzyme family protein [Chloroflexaceae bacterium]
MSIVASMLPIFIHIPALEFLMGTPERDLSDLARQYGGTRESYREESPQHSLTLAEYAIARVPVTNALYAAYIAATGTAPPLIWHGSQPVADLLTHPVVDVSWHDAGAFCMWLTETWRQSNTVLLLAEPDEAAHPVLLPNITFRLPTEAEWEHAARGTDGRTFPWGNTFSTDYANTREHGLGQTTPVGHYPQGASPYGVLDMAGNVWELTSTLDRLYPYDPHAEREDANPNTAPNRYIARGGCYMNPQGYARCATRFRFLPTVRNGFMGFRLAFSLASRPC